MIGVPFESSSLPRFDSNRNRPPCASGRLTFQSSVKRSFDEKSNSIGSKENRQSASTVLGQGKIA